MSTTGFEVLPAVDLRGGQVVRLVRGDFDRETRYGGDPVATAKRWVDEGATWLHIVDLDGARAGVPRQTSVIRAIIDSVGEGIRCQVAGGLRTDEAVADALGAGAGRVVVGTRAIADVGWTAGLVDRYGPDRVAVALDVRDDQAIGQGWRAGASGRPVAAVLDSLADAGVGRFIVTSIERDGELQGPDLELLGRLVTRRRGDIVASAGIGSVADVLAVRDAGTSGVVIGRALYEGAVSVSAVLAALGP
jgi:phosphoribosylformimino-5-aminoimidazole carboxamide ribotide isomerase